MTVAEWTVDGTLALALPMLAYRTLTTDDLPKAVVLFVAFGLVAAVAWARLAAPDVALVEAAVGAGLTGALLMGAIGWVGPAQPRRLAGMHRVALVALHSAFAVGLGAVLLRLPTEDPGLRDEVDAQLTASGVSHPVTAVLLNFRGYDTLFEVMVLLAAAVGVEAQGRQLPSDSRAAPPHPLLLVMVRMLVPGIVLVAGYLLWRGSHGPGGAFQAGAILGGAGNLLILTRTIRPPGLSSAWVRTGLLLGPAVFLVVAAAPTLAGRRLLEYPAEWAGPLILTIESALTVSIALILTLFFAGAVRLWYFEGPGPLEGRS